MLKKLILGLAAALTLGAPAFAKLQVVGAYPYIQDLVQQIGQDKVDVQTLASGDWDPHFIVPKPSLLTKLRAANLLIINGAQLEIGWLPPLLSQAGNASIQPGRAGFLELATRVALIQKPQSTSRALGDVHPQGNPHFLLNPDNMPRMADAVTQKLCQLDGADCQVFQQRNAGFKTRWAAASAGWAKRMARFKGSKVVEYHRLHDYFFSRYGIGVIGTLEPLPGIPPTPQHLSEILAQMKEQKVGVNVRGVYNPADPSNFVSQHSGARLVSLPHDVGAVPEARDVFSLFEALLKRFGA